MRSLRHIAGNIKAKKQQAKQRKNEAAIFILRNDQVGKEREDGKEFVLRPHEYPRDEQQGVIVEHCVR